MDSQKTARRMMLAGGFMVAGLVMLGITRLGGSASQALEGGEEIPRPAEAKPRSGPAANGTIHLEPGDPFPPATPIKPPSANAAQGPDQPIAPSDQPSREELIHQVIALHARVAALEAEEAQLKEELKRAGH
jgi:hypothetical protein